VQDNQHSNVCVARVSTSDICSIEDLAAAKDVTTVIQLKVNGMEEEAVIAVQLMLCEYLDNISLRSSMAQKQIELCARLMIEKHPHLPFPSAFNVFFTDALCKKFGDYYGRMDIPTLMGWLDIFERRYFEQVEERAYQEHQSTKGEKANYAEIIKENAGYVQMPESLERKMHIKRESTLADDIRYRVISDNSYLFSVMACEDAQREIEKLINDELIKNNIFNLD
jgi:hypothetical protein